MNTSLYGRWTSAVLFLATTGVALCLSASAWALPWNLQVRSAAVPNSCEFAAFQAELKVTNVGTSPSLLSQVFVALHFDAGPDEIEAVHPEGSIAGIFDAQGGFVSFDTVTVQKRQDFPLREFAPDRRANQTWAVMFDPPSAVGQSILVPAGGFATTVVTLRRAGGASPFDEGCNDFTKVESNATGEFVDDPFFSLIFTSTQQLICERFDPDTIDPNSGIGIFSFASSCPQ